MRETRRYILPITGEVLDWESFSGNPVNPVRVVGPHEFARSFDYRGALVSDTDIGAAVSLVSIDADAGTAVVDVTGAPPLLDAFEQFIDGKSAATLASEWAASHLRRSVGGAKISVPLRFND